MGYYTDVKRMIRKVIHQYGMLDKNIKINLIMIKVFKKGRVERGRNSIKLLTVLL